MSDPWEDGRSNVEHLTDCHSDNCRRCNYLTDGFYMSCDGCGFWGQQDSDDWHFVDEVPYCSEQCPDQQAARPGSEA